MTRADHRSERVSLVTVRTACLTALGLAAVAVVAYALWQSNARTAEGSDASSSVATESEVPFEPSPDSAYRSAWITYWDDGIGLQSLRANAKQLDEVHPFWYEARSATDIAIQGNASFRDSVMGVASANNIKVVPTITETMKTDAFIAIAGEENSRRAHVDAVCRVAQDPRYGGIDIDYEVFALKVTTEQVEPARQAFSAFVTDLAACVHAHDKTLQVTLLPKTDDAVFAPYLGSIAPGVFDYRAIGAAADIVRPMAYDHTTPLTKPGSTDPVSWVEEVGRYARRFIPAHKVVLGVSLYGYDWNVAGGKPITARQAPITASRYGASIQYNDIAKSRTFEYTAPDETLHRVWFDSSADTLARLELVKQLGLGGVSFWALGNEDPEFWTSLPKA